ncbi:MAG: cytochrome c biogenesis heme-transporting ATPase CcmA [Rubrivivax sp.]|nr:cytochrome c biogenesis heme-transporting ATPase CcmA [Rubrivivax sp.]MBK8527800.1 cytochrome c biogenesis heme-transporting ATPase CcmA [Rubrivivax sp.]
MLETQDLACVRGDRRLFRGLDFSLAAGQLLRVEGANGAGKTSLLRLLAGLALPAAGEVRWAGQPIRRQREAYAQALLYLGHLGGLKEELTAAENLAIEADLAGTSGVDGARIADALAGWGLARQARLPLRVLSAGQRRRAALARLQLTPARLWILDEPFNALDVDAVAQLGRLIETHLAGGGLAVVTSHMDLPIAPAQLQSLRLS